MRCVGLRATEGGGASRLALVCICQTCAQTCAHLQAAPQRPKLLRQRARVLGGKPQAQQVALVVDVLVWFSCFGGVDWVILWSAVDGILSPPSLPQYNAQHAHAPPPPTSWSSKPVRVCTRLWLASSCRSPGRSHILMENSGLVGWVWWHSGGMMLMSFDGG